MSHPDEKTWWFHRRVMAYLSMVGLFILLIGMFRDGIPTGSEPLAEALAWVFCVNLLYYYGGNAINEVFGKRIKSGVDSER